ncbi:MAG: 50S ribosomal protein L25 [Planctomycetota bacterium]|nr:50S ribosomal protein L25 [Planctomycetota bacterium]
MAHDTPTITATLRDRTGTRFSKRLRESGRLPAVIYGHKTDPVSVSVDAKEVITHLQHGSHVFTVDVEGSKSETCLVKDLQFGYLGDNIIHMDLARVNLDEEVHVNVHLNFSGTPEEGKATGAIVSHPLSELEIICKVSAIPEEIKVDTSEHIGLIMTVGDMQLPEGMRTEVNPGTPILMISFVAADEPEGEEVDVAEVAGTEPEVLTKAKEEGAEGES